MKIGYKKRFQKEFKKLSPKIKNQFYTRLDIFKNNRFDQILNNHSVDKEYSGCRSINLTGDYRAIFEDFGEIIIFLHIGTHSELYKK